MRGSRHLLALPAAVAVAAALLSLAGVAASTEDERIADWLAVHTSALYNTKRAQSRLERSIMTRWEHEFFPGVLDHSMTIPRYSWSILEQKLVVKLLSNAVDPSTAFVISFTGSSVTAAHDNLYADGFVSVFNDTMRPLFQRLGLKLIVRNQGIGNNPCVPYDFCLPAHAGDDSDVVVWEQSMNCGGRALPIETFTRLAMAMPNKPALLFVWSSQPGWAPRVCTEQFVQQQEAMYKEARPKPRGGNGTEDWQMYAQTSQVMHGLRIHSRRTFGSLFDTYAAAAPHGLSLMPTSIKHYQCLGPYSKDFAVPSAGPVRQHPGKKQHELRGHIQSLYYSSVLRMAVEDVRKMKIADADQLRERLAEAKAKLAELQSGSMPPPFSCGKYCTDALPTCYTQHEPNEQNRIDDIVVLRDESWRRAVNALDTFKIEDPETCKRCYRDRKMCFATDEQGGRLAVVLRPTITMPIFICEPIYDRKRFRVHLNDAMDAYLHLNHPDPSSFDVPLERIPDAPRIKLELLETHEEMTTFSTCFQSKDPVPPGTHVLVMVPQRDLSSRGAADVEKSLLHDHIYVSHIITW